MCQFCVLNAEQKSETIFLGKAPCTNKIIKRRLLIQKRPLCKQVNFVCYLRICLNFGTFLLISKICFEYMIKSSVPFILWAFFRNRDFYYNMQRVFLNTGHFKKNEFMYIF